MNIEDLLMDVKLIIPAKTDNEILFALRKSYIKFLNTGRFETIPLEVDLIEDQYTYIIPTPGDTFIQVIMNASHDGYRFNGTNAVVFDSDSLKPGEVFSFEAILGYKAGAISFNNMAMLERYSEAIVNGACARLDLLNGHKFNLNFHNALSEAMMSQGLFTGIEG